MQKKRTLIKILAALMLLCLCSVSLLGCYYDEDDEEEFEPYPYKDLSVYMDVPDYKNFTIKREVLDKLVNAELMSFCESNGLTFTVEDGSAAQMYDYVYVGYNGKVDGMTMMDDGAVSDGYYLLLGSDGFIEGFEDGIVGMAVGDRKDITVQLPADYGSAQYAGKEAVFTVDLKEIIRMPEITDKICQDYSVYDTKDEFMAALEEHCLFDYEWQMLMSKCTLKGYPEKEYTEYYQYFTGFFYDVAEAEGLTLAEFLAQKAGYYRSYGLWKGMSEEQFREVATSYAKSNLVNDLLTYSIMRLEKIEIEGAEWDAAVEILEREYGMTYAKIVKDSGQTAAIISVLNIRISNILTGYATVVD